MDVTMKLVPRKEGRLMRKCSKADKATTEFAAMRVKYDSPNEYQLIPLGKMQAATFKHAETCRALQHELALNIRGAVMRNPALMDIISQSRTALVSIDILMQLKKPREDFITSNSAPEDVDMKQPQIWGEGRIYSNGNAYSTYIFHRKAVQSEGKKINLGRIVINLKKQTVTIDYPKNTVGFATSEMETSKIWRIFEIGAACLDYCNAIKKYVPQ